MKHSKAWTLPICLLAALAPGCAQAAPDGAEPPAEPARVEVSVVPRPVDPGARAEVTLKLTPKDGIKINRYPQVKLSVDGREGVAAPGSAAVGDDTPPPIDRMSGNYFDEVEPLRVSLEIDRRASSGNHELSGQLTYFYCVTRSGFCAPARTPVKIALAVR